MSNICALDLETAPTIETQNPYALEPFRYKQGLARITDLSINFGSDVDSILIRNPTKEQILDTLKKLEGKIIFMHHALFDVAWLYAYIGIDLLTKLDVRCTMLLAKWIHNSQQAEFSDFSYDLPFLVDFHLFDDPLAEDFIKLKSDPNSKIAGGDSEYWSKRADWDTYMTYKLALKLMDILPKEQRRGYLISQKDLPYVARSWVEGIPFDYEKIQEIKPKIEVAKTSIAKSLGLAPSLIQSNTQLSKLLFEEWGLTPITMNKTGGSVAADDLKMLSLQNQGTEVGDAMGKILQYKKIQTLQTKYVNGFERCREYVGKDVCHGSPRIFGTYTGRYTYSSKTLRKNIWQISIAMHQLPRKGPAKSWLVAPEGYDVLEVDATGQEIAFMAIMSGDANMCNVLNEGLNIHSWMATNITGDDYDTFISRLHSQGPEGKKAYEQRQAAKLTNLSCQYRISAPALKKKFFGDYDWLISDRDAQRYLRIYKTAYPGVVTYWKEICRISQARGYTETIARRRFYLTDWQSHKWATESSAINTPIQGSGGDQKDLCIWLISENFPELRFALDMHDGLYFFIPKQNQDELKKDVLSFTNKIEYEKYWDYEIKVPLRFDAAVGENFKEKEEYEV